MNNLLVIFTLLVAFITIGLGIYYIIIADKKKAVWKNTVKYKFAELDKNLNANDINILKSNLMEADKLLGYTLQKYAYKGETLAERLKAAKNAFDKNTYNEIWAAHKMRNKIAHEINYSPNEKELKKHYSNLKKGVLSLF